MDFTTLNTLIPHATGEKLHVLTMAPYNGITLAMPGRHQTDTPVPGADFVVMVSDANIAWVSHQFTHDAIFEDIERKAAVDQDATDTLMDNYAAVVFGSDPDDFKWERGEWKDSLHPTIFLHAVQCLAVAEHRRYAKFEKRGGGRYLPARFASGIVEGLWTAADCKAVQRMGRPGVELLESRHGKPTSLKVRV